jgi:deoxyribodipyrimidine photo-lyase
MIGFRRVGWNFALQRAAEWARRLGRPLVVFEALRAGHRWASDRFHRFVLEGMADHAGRLARSEALYYPYVEAAPGAGRGLLAALASRACVVVTDDSPVIFLPRMVAAAARLPVALEKVDANGLLPLAAAAQEFVTAYQFRRFLQRTLPAHLGEMPAAHPLTRLPPRLRALPAAVLARWPAAEPAQQGYIARYGPQRGEQAAPLRGAGR